MLSVIYFGIQLISLTIIVPCLIYYFPVGKIGKSVRNRLIGGFYINDVKNLDALKCIGYYNSNKYTAKCKRMFYSKVLVLSFVDEQNNNVLSFNVTNEDSMYFGYAYTEIGSNVIWDTCDYGGGNISVYAKDELVRIRNKISGIEEKPKPKRNLTKYFKKSKEVIIE